MMGQTPPRCDSSLVFATAFRRAGWRHGLVRWLAAPMLFAALAPADGVAGEPHSDHANGIHCPLRLLARHVPVLPPRTLNSRASKYRRVLRTLVFRSGRRARRALSSMKNVEAS